MIDTCLRIFETVTSAAPTATALLAAQAAALAPALSRTLLASFLLTISPPSPDVEQRALDCLMSTLKLLVDLTTEGAEWAGVLGREAGLVGTLVRVAVATRKHGVKGRFVSDKTGGSGEDHAEGKEDHKFDVLCLVLGVLANLVESEGEVKKAIRETSK